MAENKEKLKINVSFPQYDKHIYDFIKQQPNPSAFIRKLVEGYMNGVQPATHFIPPTHIPQPAIEPKTEEEVVVEEEKEEEVSLEAGSYVAEFEDVNLDKIDEMPF